MATTYKSIVFIWGLLAVFSACTRRGAESNSEEPKAGAGPALQPAARLEPSRVPVGGAVEKDHDLPLSRVVLPRGFKISLYATGVDDARSMVLSPNYTLYVGTRKADKVYAIPNRARGPVGDRVITIAEDLNSPNGVAFHNGALYVAEISKILRFDGIDARLNDPPKPRVVFDKLPDDGHHGWKFIAIGPDDMLYVPVGAPCNICEKEDARYASLTRLKLDGTGFEVFARGIRNTVGFAWHPVTKELWFTENGRDRMGDDTPPDELNVAPKAQMHFGYPYCHGKNIPDPEYGQKRACATFTSPVRELGPHVAALGMRFYTGSMFPPAYRNQIFIAEHGSWDRSQKIGYRIMLVKLEGQTPISYEVFAEGWLKGDSVWGRPVDVLVMPDGALLVSDDEADAIYRISYQAT